MSPALALMLCRVAIPDPHIPTHEVDVIEINHLCHWDQADLEWDLQLCQLIAWKDSKTDTVGYCEKCLDWLPINERTKKGQVIYPKLNKLKDGRWTVLIEHRGEQHRIVGQLVRYTYTEHDPELWHRKTFGREAGLWRD